MKLQISEKGYPLKRRLLNGFPKGTRVWKRLYRQRICHSMTYPLTTGQLPAGEYEHGLRTAQTESRPRQSWIHELRLRHGNNLTCAVFRCTNPATHGAHLRVSMWKELISFVGKGGQAVVPFCAPCHNGARGGGVRVNNSPCVWDPNSPYDF